MCTTCISLSVPQTNAKMREMSNTWGFGRAPLGAGMGDMFDVKLWYHNRLSFSELSIRRIHNSVHINWVRLRIAKQNHIFLVHYKMEWQMICSFSSISSGMKENWASGSIRNVYLHQWSDIMLTHEIHPFNIGKIIYSLEDDCGKPSDPSNVAPQFSLFLEKRNSFQCFFLFLSCSEWSEVKLLGRNHGEYCTVPTFQISSF